MRGPGPSHGQGHGASVAILVAIIGALGLVLAAVAPPLVQEYLNDRDDPEAPTAQTEPLGVGWPTTAAPAGDESLPPQEIVPTAPIAGPTPTAEPTATAWPDPTAAVDPPSPLRFVSATANLRDRPSSDSLIVTILEPGTEVRLRGDSAVSADGTQWSAVTVTATGEVGWVVSSFLVR